MIDNQEEKFLTPLDTPKNNSANITLFLKKSAYTSTTNIMTKSNNKNYLNDYHFNKYKLLSKNSDLIIVKNFPFKKKNILIININKDSHKNFFELFIPIKSIPINKKNEIDKELKGKLIFNTIYELSENMKMKLFNDKLVCKNYKLSFFKENFDTMNFEQDFYEYAGEKILCKISYNKKKGKSNLKIEINNENSKKKEKIPKTINKITQIDMFQNVREIVTGKKSEKTLSGLQKSNYVSSQSVENLITNFSNITKDEPYLKSIFTNQNFRKTYTSEFDYLHSKEIHEYGRDGLLLYQNEYSQTENQFYKIHDKRIISNENTPKYSNKKIEHAKVNDGNIKNVINLPQLNLPTKKNTQKNLSTPSIKQKVKVSDNREQLKKKLSKNLDIPNIDYYCSVNVSRIILSAKDVLNDTENLINMHVDIMNMSNDTDNETKLETGKDNLSKKMTKNEISVKIDCLQNEILDLIKNLKKSIKNSQFSLEKINLYNATEENEHNHTEIEDKIDFLIFAYLTLFFPLDNNFTPNSDLITLQTINYLSFLKREIASLLRYTSKIFSLLDEKLKKDRYKIDLYIDQYFFYIFLINTEISKKNFKLLKIITNIFIGESNKLNFEEYIKFRKVINLSEKNGDKFEILKSKHKILKKIIKKVLHNKSDMAAFESFLSNLKINEGHLNHLLFLNLDKSRYLKHDIEEINIMYENILSYLKK